MTQQQLSPLDASFLYLESERISNHIGGLYIYDQSTVPGGRLRFQQILRYMESHLQRTPRFRQKVAKVPLNLDHPYWVDDSRFDIEYHVRHSALPYPGDWRQLCILTSRIYDRPLDLNRPLWTFNVIEGLDNVEGLPAGSFAVLTKIHHAALDGTSSVAMNTALHETEPGLRFGEPDDWNPGREPNGLELISQAYLSNLVQPLKMIKTLAESMPAQARILAAMGEDSMQAAIQATPVPKTRFNGSFSGRRGVNGLSFDLSQIRAIKDAVRGATVNDVVLALVGGGLRRYLDSKGELPQESLSTMAPISVRTAGTVGGNEVSGMLATLATNEADPLARLKTVASSTAQSKELTNAVGARLMTDIGQFIPAATAGLAARLFTQMNLGGRMQPLFNTVVTNVPGPQQPLYFCGAEMINQYGLGIVQDGLTLFHTVLSYNGKVTLTAPIDREAMPDSEFYMSCLRDSFDDLYKATKPVVVRQNEKDLPKPAPKKAAAKVSATASSKTPARVSAKAPAKPVAGKRAAAKTTRPRSPAKKKTS